MSDQRRVEELLWSIMNKIDYLEAKNQKRYEEIKEKIRDFKAMALGIFIAFCLGKFFSGPEKDRQEFYSTIMIVAAIAILLGVIYFSYRFLKFLFIKIRNFLSE